ncbi:MAG: hypothetical protein NTX50_30985 [Candidatus Sumerlaeota bacterium]|nr:hypothetical protein [Candidatus Sumerlaeota bacterium]
MTSKLSEKSVSLGESKSDSWRVEIHVLECGHGDTILIGLPGNRWALIDCNLVDNDGTRDKFFTLVQKLGITRLDILCLTHPHKDHYHGMLDVINYFKSDGRTIGCYCDCGVDPKQIVYLLKKANEDIPHIEEYGLIQIRIDELTSSGMGYVRIDENTDLSNYIEDKGLSFRITPLGPDPAIPRRFERETISVGEIHNDINRLSVILLFEIRATSGKRLRVLLTGDTDSDGLTRSCRIMDKKLQESTIHGMKGPHHGSHTAFSPDVCKARSGNATDVVVFSVGTKFEALPDRNVIEKYLQKGWTVLLTNKRIQRTSRSIPLTLAGRSPEIRPRHLRNDIKLIIDSDGGFSFEPDAARVLSEEISLYQASSDAE